MRNKIYKNLITIMCIFTIMIFGMSTVNAEEKYVNYYGIEMSSQELANLKSLAFTDDEIYYMSLEDFNNNRYLSGEIVAVDKKYYKTIYYYNNVSTFSLNENEAEPYYWNTVEISEEEYENSDNEILPFGMCGTVSTEYKLLTNEIVKLGTNKFRYKADLTWKKMPKTRSYDIMSIGIEPDFYVASDRYFKRIATRRDLKNEACVLDESTSHKWDENANGALVTFKLPENQPFYSIVNLSSHMYFTIGKRTGTTIYALNAYANYKHAQKSVTADISGSVSVGLEGAITFGVNITPTVKESYDSMSTAHAIYDGLNWK